MHQHAVADLDRDLGEVLVRSMHGVARLEGGDLRPAERGEQRARLARRHEQRAVPGGVAAGRQHLDRAGEVDLALVHHQPDARVCGVGRPEHGRALVLLVDRVFLGDQHGRQHLAAVRIDEREILAGPDGSGERGASRQRDRNRPEQAARGLHPVADSPPVGMRHEAVERREAADAEHDDVAALARGDDQARERGRAPLLRGEGGALEQEWAEVAAAVRVNQRHDGRFLPWKRVCRSAPAIRRATAICEDCPGYDHTSFGRAVLDSRHAMDW